MPDKKIYKGVYLAKFVMAILVVMIHTGSWNLMGFVETAVPFFFIASGFFLFRKTEKKSRSEELRIIGQWIWKALKLYGIWSLIYLPFAIYGYHSEGLPLTKAILHYVRNFIFVGENFLSWPLWYLLALVWGGALIWVMTKLRFPIWVMILIGAALTISTHFIDYPSIELYAKVFRDTRNGIFVGLLYLATGGLLQRLHLQSGTIWYALAAAGCFIGLQFTHWFLYPLTVFLFLLSSTVHLKPIDRHMAKGLGSMSRTIYLIHMLFAGCFMLLVGIPKPSLGLFALTLGMSAATAAAVFHFQDRSV